MNSKLLQSQFDRVIRDPGDTRLLKQLAVELGSALVLSRPESLREYRVAAATALRGVEEARTETPEAAFARGVLSALLDAAGCAEEALTAEREREEVRSVAGRPLHRQILRALNGRALTTKALAEQLDRQKSQVSAALGDLEGVGLIRAVERLPQANQKEKPYRLTLTGATVLDGLPADEPKVIETAAEQNPNSGTQPVGEMSEPAPSAEWFDLVAVSFEALVTTGIPLRPFSGTVARTGPIPSRADVRYGTLNTGCIFHIVDNSPRPAKRGTRGFEHRLEDNAGPAGQQHRLSASVSGG